MIFSKSAMKRSNTFKPPFQKLGAATFKPNDFADFQRRHAAARRQSLHQFGHKRFAFLQVPLIEGVDEHLGVDVGVVVEAVVCHVVVGFHGPFRFHFGEPCDGVAEDAVASFWSSGCRWFCNPRTRLVRWMRRVLVQTRPAP